MRMKFISLIILLPIITLAQSSSPVEHMKKVGASQETITKDTWAYMRAAANGRSARTLDKKRQELIKTFFNAKNQVSQVPSFQGDYSYKAAMAQYYQLVMTILREDYSKIMDLEAIAENSFDAMEAYLQIQEQVDVKMDSAYTKLTRVQKQFATNNNINLIEAESNRMTDNIRRTARVTGYFNDAFLIYYKVQNQERYLLEAFQEQDVGKIDQARIKLDEMANQGKVEAKELGPFGSDRTVLSAVIQWMDFYIAEAKESEKIIEFFFISDELKESQKYMSSKKQQDLTQEDVDNHNRLVEKYNMSVNSYNSSTEKLNAYRSQRFKSWSEVKEKFYKNHL